MSSLSDVVKLQDPQFYVDDPFPIFARMQKEAPVFFYEPLNVFVLTKHEDVKYASRTPEIFSVSKGLLLNDAQFADSYDEGVNSLLDLYFPTGGENIGTTDPPRHREIRRVISPAFAGRTLGRLEEMLRRVVKEMLDDIVPGEDTDWMEFASVLPLRVAVSLIGVPETDLPAIRRWNDLMETIGQDLSLEELQETAKDFSTVRGYILEQFEAKKGNLGDDLLSALVTADIDNEALSEANVQMLTMVVLAAGGDTTRALILGMILAFAQHPEQWERLREDRSLVPSAVEESLRWVAPVRAFLRAVMQDTEVRGQKINAGQFVYLMYMAANHDEEIFPHPNTFDIERKENFQQLSFGFGTHVCIAAALVRYEAGILLNGLLDRFSRIEVVGEPTRVVSLFRNSWSDMTARFHA